MDISQVYRISNQLTLASPKDVDELESHYATKFPLGYREFVTQLGTGRLNDFIRVYSPQKIVDKLVAEFRPRWDEYLFWDENPELTKQQVLESIIFADTIQGDELIFRPDGSEDVYLLGRYSKNLPNIGGGLFQAIDWIQNGNLCPPVKHAYFCPSNVARVELRGSFPGPDRALEVFRATREILLKHGDDLIITDDELGIDDEEGEVSYFHQSLIRPTGAQLSLLLEPNSEAKTYSITPYSAPEVSLVVFHDPVTPPALLSSIYDEMHSLGLSREK